MLILLLILNDAGPSLQGALHVMNTYSTFTGLLVNWHKSLLFPVVEGPWPHLMLLSLSSGWTNSLI